MKLGIFNIFKKKTKNEKKTCIRFSSVPIIEDIETDDGILNIIKKSVTELTVTDNDNTDRVALCIGSDHPNIVKIQSIIDGSIQYSYEKAGEVVTAQSDGRTGIIMKIDNFTGQVTVLQQIYPPIYCIYDNYDMLTKIYKFSQLNESIIRDIPN